MIKFCWISVTMQSKLVLPNKKKKTDLSDFVTEWQILISRFGRQRTRTRGGCVVPVNTRNGKGSRSRSGGRSTTIVRRNSAIGRGTSYRDDHTGLWNGWNLYGIGCTEDLNETKIIRSGQGKTSGTNLANINVVAILIDLRVVMVEDGVVGARGRRDGVARVAGYNGVGGYAILIRGGGEA